MDRIDALTVGSRSTLESGTRVRAGLVVGRNLLLWNLLVAHLSNDPLCAYFSLAGLSTFIVAYCTGRSVSRCIQLAVVATDHSNWFRCGRGSTVLMDCLRMDPLCGNRPIVERVGLFAGISSFADSVGALGWCICRQFPDRHSQFDLGFCSAKSQEERVGSLRLSPRL